MWGVLRALVRQGVFVDRPGSRIELADIPFEIRCEPDVSLAIGNEAMRTGVWSLQTVLAYFTGCGIQAPEGIGHLARVPQGAIGCDRGIVRVRIGRRHVPFSDNDALACGAAGLGNGRLPGAKTCASSIVVEHRAEKDDPDDNNHCDGGSTHGRPPKYRGTESTGHVEDGIGILHVLFQNLDGLGGRQNQQLDP